MGEAGAEAVAVLEQQVGVLKMDPENPFTIATSGGYSAVIVRQGADVEPILFANGEQVNLRHVNFAELSFPHGRKVSEQISQLAIASALVDTEMLHEMGLVAQNGHFEEEESKTVIECLKVSGARRVACEEVLRDDVDWDIYQIAAGLSSPPVLFAAAVCAAIQIGAPIAVFYVNLQLYKEEIHVITTDASQGLEPRDVVIVFFLRMVFVLYNLILELRALNDAPTASIGALVAPAAKARCPAHTPAPRSPDPPRGAGHEARAARAGGWLAAGRGRDQGGRRRGLLWVRRRPERSSARDQLRRRRAARADGAAARGRARGASLQ